MKKILLSLLLILTAIMPFSVFALSDDYKDVVSEISGIPKASEDAVVVYMF